MTESFDALTYWENQRSNAETALIIAQKEIRRLVGAECLVNVIEVDFRREDFDDAA